MTYLKDLGNEYVTPDLIEKAILLNVWPKCEVKLEHLSVICST